jgi:hypothetical protein
MDYDTANSVIEFSTDGTYTDGTGKLVLIHPSVNNSNGPGIEWIPVDVYNVIIKPGESLTITLENDNGVASNVFSGFFLEERF